jgi:hypothetical protein
MNFIPQVRLNADLLREKEKLAIAKKELADAQSKVEMIQYRVDYIHSLLEAKDVTIVANGEDIIGPSQYAARVGGSTPDWIEAVLRDAGNELPLKEIVRRILDKGLAGPDADADNVENNVSSVLQRSGKLSRPRFQKVGRGVYDLVSR